MKVTFIIPCFNERRTILQLLARVRAVVMPDGVDKEIIIVDDGSADGCASLLREHTRDMPDVRLHTSVINIGKGVALRIGLAMATGDIIVIQDADLELYPEEVPQLIGPILDGRTDVVFGSRFLGQRKYPKSLSYLANVFLSRLTSLLYRHPITDMETCYKIFRRSILAGVRLRAVGFEIEPELTAKFLRMGHDIIEMPITYTPRTNSEGKKIRAWDGLKAVYYLIKYRFLFREKLLSAPAPVTPDPIAPIAVKPSF